MPKFVSGSSGHIYAHNKSGNKSDDEDDVDKLIGNNNQTDVAKQKPSAINKKGTKEKQKNSLDLFKEELRRLHEERNKNKLKKTKYISSHFDGPITEESLSEKASPCRDNFPRYSGKKSHRRSRFYNRRDRHPSQQQPLPPHIQHNDTRIRGTLSSAKRETLRDLLQDINPTKTKVGSTMMFCINNSFAAKEIIDCICDSLLILETQFQKKIARLFLISDVLNNCSAPVSNASYYRQGFQSRLVVVFEHLNSYLINLKDRQEADKFKQKALSVLGAWKEWTVYEDEFLIKLSNILLGIKGVNGESHEFINSKEIGKDNIDSKNIEGDLDGLEIDDDLLGKCLEDKGLSFRWYKTLALSDDEDEDEVRKEVTQGGGRTLDKSPKTSEGNSTAKGEKSFEKIRFKASKWETVDPNEVADQVVTISKWETMVKDEDLSGSTDSSYEDEQATSLTSNFLKKPLKSSSSSSSS